METVFGNNRFSLKLKNGKKRNLGNFKDQFELAKTPFKGSIKQIPNPIKKVDLMRKLY
tara:strand:+ start:300 stop:473 length:174 start_codon:yes stop_codon:yes gene_type:complete